MSIEILDILEDIIKDFAPEKFTKFFREKNRSFAPRSEDLSFYNDENFKNCLKLGQIEFTDADNKLIIAAVEVKSSLSERSGKKAQYEKAKKILKDIQYYDYGAGIFIFYDAAGNFRFSLIYANYLGSERKWSTFRRFTYYVSEELTNKTFLDRIGNGNFETFENIKEAFSVEKVTSKFFEEFRKIFERTKQEFEKYNKNTVCSWLKERYSEEEYKEQINRFAYTFLGRIIFIYFLQRKGWIENQKNFIRKIIEKRNNINLYSSFFEPLFFEVFAKKEPERKPEIREQYQDTPYLNGGLFEKSDLEDELEKNTILISFKDNFIRDIILDFFENYNFTIDENSIDDQEVSIDPEMLGKVFENTLAEEERGKKGTFYTPREIVHFMVKESLIQFLINETKIDCETLKKFIYENKELEELKLTIDQIRLVDKKLEQLKVLDPAVGSAAFPVEMMQILVLLRKKLCVKVGKNINEVTLKKQFIKNNLYGVDIDPGAIEIAKLRLWLSLIVDYEKSEAEPLPNLDFQFRVGNSLQEKIGSIDIFKESEGGKPRLLYKEGFESIKQEMLSIKDKFYLSDNEEEKKKLKRNFDQLEHRIMLELIEELNIQWRNEASIGKAAERKASEIEKEIENLKQKIKDGTYKLFKPDFHFSEVFDRKDESGNKIAGFDIIIGNPPYGVKVEDDIVKYHGLGSKDSYGVFISTALKRFLKPKGVLSYIVSDTWLTIKTHKQLRKQVLEKQIHKIVRFHQDCFDATVNACVILLTNYPNINEKLLAVDLTNISTRKEIEDLREKLQHLENYIGSSMPKFAVYEYHQDLIKTNSSLPIFVGSPNIFLLTNDELDSKKVLFSNELISVREIKKDCSSLFLLKLDEFAEVKKGLATCDNKQFYFKEIEGRGNYKIVNNSDVLSVEEINQLSEDEKLEGINPKEYNNRFLVPLDKGEKADIDSNWLPNYYVKNKFYIDWSKKAVKTIYSLGGMRNPNYQFKKGISFSWTGFYAPTFRINTGCVFDQSSSFIFQCLLSTEELLGILSSKISKYIVKNFCDHTVNSTASVIEKMIISIPSNKIKEKINKLVKTIILKQTIDSKYDYISNEQKEIDKLVYEMYGLNKDDIREVETWYARRYPKLAKFCDIS